MKRFNIKLPTNEPYRSITLFGRGDDTWTVSKWEVTLLTKDLRFTGINFRGYGTINLNEEIVGLVLTAINRDNDDDSLIVLTLMRKP